MLRVIPFKVAHLESLAEQEHSAHLRAYAKPEDLRVLEGAPSWTVIDDDAVLACGGALPRWSHVAQAWSYLGKGRPQHFLWIHKRVLQFLNTCGFARVETAVRTDFEKGHKWARMLGFEMEAPRMRLYGPDRADYSLYARIR